MSLALRHGPLSERTAHIAVDMQNLFSSGAPWHVPWMERVLPVVAAIAERHAHHTIFTRFIPPDHPEQAQGTWRRYYERWRSITRERIDPELLALVPPLASLVPPAVIIDKHVYSPFANPQLSRLLRNRMVDSLVLTGLESDVCVLSAALDAVDRGYRVVIVTDALCSSSDRTHDAILTIFRGRFSEQIETCDGETILSHWR
jgi:nicotinamidase-related amidase